MFSLLNRNAERGKFRARRCKILNSWSQFFRSVWRGLSRSRYLIASKRLRSVHSGRVGHPIALLVRQPALIRIGSRKD